VQPQFLLGHFSPINSPKGELMICESCVDGTDGYGKCNTCGRIIKQKPLMWPEYDEDE